MKIKILKEEGYEEALLGLSLSYNQFIESMPEVARRLAFKDTGENKFLRFMVVWLDIIAPRYWWVEMDTYKVGKEQLSQSTMHTLLKRTLIQEDFETEMPEYCLRMLNYIIAEQLEVDLTEEDRTYIKSCRDIDLWSLKNLLPEGFLQRRIMVTNYATLQRIIRQRKEHKLPEWKHFIEEVLRQVKYPEFLED